MGKPVAPGATLSDMIALVIEQSCRCWNAQDYRGLRELWESGDAEPWCIAEDVESPMIGWPALEAYWQTNLGLLERSETVCSDLRVKRSGPGFALAMYVLRFTPKIAGPRAALSGECRVTALLRHHRKSWRFCHLAEAPLSPSVYMRRLFESEAAGSDQR